MGESGSNFSGLSWDINDSHSECKFYYNFAEIIHITLDDIKLSIFSYEAAELIFNHMKDSRSSNRKFLYGKLCMHHSGSSYWGDDKELKFEWQGENMSEHINLFIKDLNRIADLQFYS